VRPHKIPCSACSITLQILVDIASMSSADTIPSVEAPAHATPSLKKYEATLQDEMKIQAALYPTPDDVPGCMQLL
jgi:hypothetical protein